MDIIEHASDHHDSDREHEQKHNHGTEIDTPGHRKLPANRAENRFRDPVNCLNDRVVREPDPRKNDTREQNHKKKRNDRVQDERDCPEYIQ